MATADRASLSEALLIALRSWALVPAATPSNFSSDFASLPEGARVAPRVFTFLASLGLDIHDPSPLTSHLPWVSSPAPILTAVVSYLLVVSLWSLYIRSRGLKPRASEPNALQALVVLHNLFLCGLSLYMGCGIAVEAWKSRYSLWGNPYDHQGNKTMAFYIYLFYMSKVYEFLDTAIMLLKRNLRQVSYLHVYHHATIPIIWWIMTYRCPGGDSYYSAAFNSWIHVIMYSYYLLAAAIGKNERRRQKYLFWGKYLTVLQMVQFVSFIGQAVYGMLHPGLYPQGIDNLLFFYSLSLLLFFLDFFVKKHVSAGGAKTAHSKGQPISAAQASVAAATAKKLA